MKTFKQICEINRRTAKALDLKKADITVVPNEWVYKPKDSPGYDSWVYKTIKDIDLFFGGGQYGNPMPELEITQIRIYSELVGDENPHEAPKTHKALRKRLDREVTKFMRKLPKGENAGLLYSSTTGLRGEDWTSERSTRNLFMGKAYMYRK